jgi:hypothetical protein
MGDQEPEMQDVVAYWRACLRGDWGAAKCISDMVRTDALLEMFAGAATRDLLAYSGLSVAELDEALSKWQQALADGSLGPDPGPGGGPEGGQ